ncbi:MAG: SIS domain-containing protein [Chloroflexota bacterium]|nr:SIS domain-containing protein [Chloroflexota bacterium]
MTTQLETEILEQPDALRRLLTNEREKIARVAQAIRDVAPKFVVITARGTSDNAARYSQYLFSTFNGLQAALATPSTFTIYGKPPRLHDALVIAISQSGQSPDIVTVIEEGRRQGALTLAVTNAPDSPLARAADYTIYLHANPELAVGATKSYTTSLMAMAMLADALAQTDRLIDALALVPDWVSEITNSADSIIHAAERYTYMQYGVVASRGYNYATAYEIALKLKELTYVMAEPYSSADFLHGPIALVEQGFPVIAVVPEGALEAELTAFAQKLSVERGADLIVISANQDALRLAQTPLPLPVGIPEWLSPIVAVVPGQLFALGLALAKRIDPDRPRGLLKVTLTA